MVGYPWVATGAACPASHRRRILVQKRCALHSPQLQSARLDRHAALANLFVFIVNTGCTSERNPCQLLFLCKVKAPHAAELLRQ